MAPPKGATTPYFAFVNANRAAAKAALLEAGAPAGMGDVGKELGARWRALSDEEKKARAPFALRGACAAAVHYGGGVCGALVSHMLVCACASGLTARATAPRRRCMLIRLLRRRRRCAPPRRAQSAAFEAPVLAAVLAPRSPAPPRSRSPPRGCRRRRPPARRTQAQRTRPGSLHTTRGPLSRVRRSSSLRFRDAQTRGAGGGGRARHTAVGARETHHPPRPGREANAARRRAPHLARNRACPPRQHIRACRRRAMQQPYSVAKRQASRMRS